MDLLSSKSAVEKLNKLLDVKIFIYFRNIHLKWKVSKGNILQGKKQNAIKYQMQNGFSWFKICCGEAKSAAWCQNQHRLLSALLDANNQVGHFIASSSLSASSSSATSSSSSSLTSISPVLLFFHTINIIFCPALSSFFCWCSPATGDICGDKYCLCI